jgi:hypothetical protein
LLPSESTRTGAGHDATPLVPPEQAKLTVTSVLFQPAGLGGGEIEAVILSRVLMFGWVDVPVPHASVLSKIPANNAAKATFFM